jgi:hypothetical protein
MHTCTRANSSKNEIFQNYLSFQILPTFLEIRISLSYKYTLLFPVIDLPIGTALREILVIKENPKLLFKDEDSEGGTKGTD